MFFTKKVKMIRRAKRTVRKQEQKSGRRNFDARRRVNQMILSGGCRNKNSITFPMQKPSKYACRQNRSALQTIEKLAKEKVQTYNNYAKMYKKHNCTAIKGKQCSEIRRNLKYHRAKADKLLFAANNAVKSYNEDLKKYPRYCSGKKEKTYRLSTFVGNKI